MGKVVKLSVAGAYLIEGKLVVESTTGEEYVFDSHGIYILERALNVQ